jgi:hypothetical protein
MSTAGNAGTRVLLLSLERYRVERRAALAQIAILEADVDRLSSFTAKCARDISDIIEVLGRLGEAIPPETLTEEEIEDASGVSFP